VCDGGWKYLSTGAYEGTVDEAEDRSTGSSGLRVPPAPRRRLVWAGAHRVWPPPSSPCCSVQQCSAARPALRKTCRR
jgi:hypothetical protein